MNHQTQTLSLEHFVSLEELSNQEVMSSILLFIKSRSYVFDKEKYRS